MAKDIDPVSADDLRTLYPDLDHLCCITDWNYTPAVVDQKKVNGEIVDLTVPEPYLDECLKLVTEAERHYLRFPIMYHCRASLPYYLTEESMGLLSLALPKSEAKRIRKRFEIGTPPRSLNHVEFTTK